MPTVITQGAASAKGYGFGARATAANYIEDVFSTYLYTGTGASQTITNGIDLSGKGGLVWLKGRSGATDHALYDTVRGATADIASNLANAQTVQAQGLTSFSSTGFSIGTLAKINTNADTYASWTFRKQAKFFDVVTYTGNGSNRTIAHNLNSVPGCIMVKRMYQASDWQVYHRTLANTQYLLLNYSGAVATDANRWNSTTPTATEFSLGTDATVNASGSYYVAYLFAHDAGGFGAAGTDNVISCGSFTTDANGQATVNLGYEPQWVFIKRTDSTGVWRLFDNMRGWGASTQQQLFADSLDLEATSTVLQVLSPTGFSITQFGLVGNSTHIYIAIRRGPMKTPTSGTSVFSPLTSSGATGTTLTTNFPVDMQWLRTRDNADAFNVIDRMRGISTTPITASTKTLFTTDTFAEAGYNNSYGWNNTGFGVPTQQGGSSTIYESFRRAPGFFDVVCYTGTGANRTVSHNLGVAPEFIQVKCRSNANGWMGYSAPTGNTKYINFGDVDSAQTFSTAWNNTSPTSSVFTVGTDNSVNGSARTYVAYLFATVAGVSKVGSYTGSGTTKQIDCGFTGGARFVLIKRTDSTGDWYVWDSARGIVSGNDPYLLLNSTAAEVTNTDYIDTYSAGFEISSTAPAAINANGGSFIFLAIA